MKRFSDAARNAESDLLSTLDEDLISLIASHILDGLKAYNDRYGVWPHWLSQEEKEMLPRYDRVMQPYSIFMVNRELREKLDRFAYRERFRVFALSSSYRVWISTKFYKRLLLPTTPFFNQRLLGKMMKENSFYCLLKKASPKAIKLVHTSLMQHWKEALICAKKSTGFTLHGQYLSVEYSLHDEDYKKILLTPMKHALIETCQCKFCFDNQSLNLAKREILLRFVKYQSKVLYSEDEIPEHVWIYLSKYNSKF
jgi:hypothetical protein